MLREEAKDEAKYVEEFCKQIGVRYFSKEVDVEVLGKELKMGTEETGRKVRYEFFNKIGTENIIYPSENKFGLYKDRLSGELRIATAHNNNDRIESIIMNILRGSGNSRFERDTCDKRK